MNRTALFMLCAGVVAATAPDRMLAQGKGDWSFQRVGTFANFKNGAVADATVSEIIAATADGKTLVYTDAVRGTVGFIDITEPGLAAGRRHRTLDPDPTDATAYSPTSVDILANRYALVTVDTSPSKLSAERPAAGPRHPDSREIVTTIDLGGQPDSTKISPDHRFLAIAIENERDEWWTSAAWQGNRRSYRSGI